jgi:hypothetical protein
MECAKGDEANDSALSKERDTEKATQELCSFRGMAFLFKAQSERHNHAPSEKTFRDLFEPTPYHSHRLVT